MNNLTMEKYNPNPGIKLLTALGLGMALLYQLDGWHQVFTVAVFSAFYILLGQVGTGVRTMIVYILLTLLPNVEGIQKLPFLIKFLLSMFFVVKIFYLPFVASKFFVMTSDVGGIIAMMDKLKAPKAITIPISVMFRFFPSFREEKTNIKMAMKMRGITRKKPIQYLEYVLVPMMVISSNIADDIAKSAETKCIGNPGKPVRLAEKKLQWIDLIFVLLIAGCQLGGMIWLKYKM